MGKGLASTRQDQQPDFQGRNTVLLYGRCWRGIRERQVVSAVLLPGGAAERGAASHTPSFQDYALGWLVPLARCDNPSGLENAEFISELILFVACVEVRV